MHRSAMVAFGVMALSACSSGGSDDALVNGVATAEDAALDQAAKMLDNRTAHRRPMPQPIERNEQQPTNASAIP